MAGLIEKFVTVVKHWNKHWENLLNVLLWLTLFRKAEVMNQLTTIQNAYINKFNVNNYYMRKIWHLGLIQYCTIPNSSSGNTFQPNYFGIVLNDDKCL